ncbi:MAG: hypothetical protein ABIR17_08670 [Pseudolysinimonas sp.]|uniref:hypothetical protein n=1 Tax=Pseudolysinimonas sp. TaxID=2680009 RepID=UPI003263CBA1
MTTASILIRALRYGVIIAVVVAIASGVIGWLVANVAGLLGGLFGAALSAIFLGLTTISMLVAGRVTKGRPGDPIFFAIVLGAWGVKLVVFIIAAVLLRGVSTVNPYVFLAAVMATVIGSLVADIVALVRTRVPYVSDVLLPGEPGGPDLPDGP